MDWDKQDLNETQRKLLDTSTFLGKLLLLGIPFQLFLMLEIETVSLQAFHAKLITSILELLGYSAVNNGLDIFLNNQIYRITQDCLGWKSMAAFTALTIAFETKFLKNPRFLIAGVGIIFIVNIVRIVTTILLSESGIISYSIIHGIFWKWGLTAVVILLWSFMIYKKGRFNFRSDTISELKN